MCLPEIWSANLSQLFGFFASPFLNSAMITRQQYVRNCPILPHARSRIVRIFEQAGLETFLFEREIISRDTRKKPDNRLKKDHGCHFTASEDVIPDTDFLNATRFDHALIQAFKASANQYNPRGLR